MVYLFFKRKFDMQAILMCFFHIKNLKYKLKNLCEYLIKQSHNNLGK